MNKMKKIFVWAAVSIAVLTGAAYAQGATLWQFYQDKGQSLPTVSQRAVDAARCGIFFYKGTVEQNKALLECLKFEESLQNVPNVDDDVIFGANPVTRYQTTLSSSMTSSQTTVPVSSITTFDGTTLTASILGGEVYLSLEAGSAKEEIVRCTGISGTTFTGCTRGLAFSGTSTTAVSANQKAHNAGSVVIMSNVHYVYNTGTKQNTWSERQDYTDGITVASTTEDIVWLGDGDGTPTAKCVVIYNGDSNKPKLCYDEATNKWLIYNDGVSSYDISAGGSGLTANNAPIYVSGSELKFATGTPAYWWSLDTSVSTPYPLRNATSTIAGGTASGTGLDDFWNSRHNATTTKPLDFTFSDNLTVTKNLSVTASTTVSGQLIARGLARTITCGEVIAGDQAVYMSATSTRVLLADSDTASSTVPFVGFALDACAADGADTTTVVQTSGSYTRTGASFTAGALYYINATAGTIGTSAGTVEGVVGRATSATEINMNVAQEVGDQYIGSASDGGNDVMEDVPLLARKAIIHVICGSVASTHDYEMTIYRIGRSSATITTQHDISGAENLYSCSASWTGNTITLSEIGNASTLVSGTAYYYR